MKRTIVACVILISCLSLLFVKMPFVELCRAFEPVIIEFLYNDEICPDCLLFKEYYEAYKHNVQVIHNILRDYGEKISVIWIHYKQPEYLSKINQYNLTAADWNSIVVNYEVVFKGGTNHINETLVRNAIDSYLHDIAVLCVIPSSLLLPIGELLEVNVTVKNEGAYNESFTVTLYYNSNVISSKYVENLEPDTEQVLTFYWNSSNVTEGKYAIFAYAEILPNERDAGDNLRQGGIVEVRSQSAMEEIHDVAVTLVDLSSAKIKAGEKVNITVVVRNMGDTIESFNVTAYCNQEIVDIKRIDNLAPNEEVTLVFVWDTAHYQPGKYKIRVEADKIPDEFDITNNIYIYDSTVDLMTVSSSINLIVALSFAFFFGFFESFSPCTIIMLSFLLSYTISQRPEFKKGFTQAMTFGLGFLLAGLLIVLISGTIIVFLSASSIALTWAACIFAIFFGLNLLGILKIPIQTKPLIKKLSKKYIATYAGIFVLGFIFYFLDPCIAPLFASIVPFAGLEMFPLIIAVFSLGILIPFLGIGIFTGILSKLVRSTYRHRFKIKAISGIILIGYASYLITFLLKVI